MKLLSHEFIEILELVFLLISCVLLPGSTKVRNIFVGGEKESSFIRFKVEREILLIRSTNAWIFVGPLGCAHNYINLRLFNCI